MLTAILGSLQPFRMRETHARHLLNKSFLP